MKNIVFLLLFILLLFSKVIGQNNLPAVYDIKTDTAVYDTLPDSCWQMLEEHSKQLTIEQVSQPPLSNNFHPGSSGKDFDFLVYAYWFRFRLKNVTDHDIQLSIPGNSLYIDLYVINKNGKINYYTTGKFVPWSGNSA